MKTKRTFLSILTLCIALLFTACSGKEAASTKSTDTKELQTQKNLRIPRLNPAQNLQTIPTLN